jgi:transposase
VPNGILFRVRGGVPWRDLPERYGPWETVYKRFARWQTDGTWARVQASLHTQAGRRAGLGRPDRLDTGLPGTLARQAAFEVPVGLTQGALEAYAELAVRVIAGGGSDGSFTL